MSSFVEWILYPILLLEIWLKLKFIYFCIYYEILIYWVLLAHFSLTLPLFRQCFFLFLLFFCLFFFFFNFVKPKLFYQYLFESLQKQQLGGILLNIYVFNLINFTKLCRLLATFFNNQKTFKSCLSVVVRVIWLRDVGQYWINVETTLRMYTLKFTTLYKVKLTLSISTLILTMLDNAETMLLIWTSSFTTLINVETTLWPFLKSWKEQKNIFELQKKGDSFD